MKKLIIILVLFTGCKKIKLNDAITDGAYGSHFC